MATSRVLPCGWNGTYAVRALAPSQLRIRQRGGPRRGGPRRGGPASPSSPQGSALLVLGGSDWPSEKRLGSLSLAGPQRAMIFAMDMGTSRAALDPDCGERFLSLRRALGVTSFGINQMVLQPGQRMRIHRHRRQEEVYLVLEGSLTVAIEGDETELGRGELMRVAPGVRRQLINYGPGRVLLVALGGAAEHDGRDAEAFRAWEEEAGADPRDVPLPDDLAPADRRS